MYGRNNNEEFVSSNKIVFPPMEHEVMFSLKHGKVVSV